MSLRRLTVRLSEAEVGAIAEALGAMPWPLSFYESDDGGWCLEALAADRAAAREVATRIALAAAACGLAPPAVADEPVPDLDWRQVARDAFPPRRIGRYRLRPGHAPATIGGIDVILDVGPAFGSGEHATTRGCLLALERLARSRRPTSILDMGTGSGVLAVAAAKTWPTRVLAVDSDPAAVANARYHARLNGVAGQVRVIAADGFGHRETAGPFDLIFANILARPLIAMAGALTKALAAGGTAVLSGLLVRHQGAVLAAYRARGLALGERLVRDGWATLVLRRRSPGHPPPASPGSGR